MSSPSLIHANKLGGIIQKPVGFQVNVKFYVPSGYVKIAIEHGPVEMVDLPIN